MYDSDSDSGFEIATQEPGIAEAFWNTSVKANETDVTDYEKERLERIAINQQRLNILGLSSTVWYWKKQTQNFRRKNVTHHVQRRNQLHVRHPLVVQVGSKHLTA